MDIGHLHLHVRDVPASVEFYRRHFGLKVRHKEAHIVFLTDGRGFDLALAPDPDPAPLPSWFHFGFRLGSPLLVKRLYERLVDADVHMVQSLVEEQDASFFRCEDPDGYRIEVYWEPAPAPPKPASKPPSG